jgi:hypothetical protein
MYFALSQLRGDREEIWFILLFQQLNNVLFYILPALYGAGINSSLMAITEALSCVPTKELK